MQDVKKIQRRDMQDVKKIQDLDPGVAALLDLARMVEDVLENALMPWKIGSASYRILGYLATTSLTPSQLSALLCQETHSVSGLLNRMEDRELISRTHDREDRRVVRVTLAPAGAQLLLEAESAMRGAVALFPVTMLAGWVNVTLHLRDATVTAVGGHGRRAEHRVEALCLINTTSSRGWRSSSRS